MNKKFLKNSAWIIGGEVVKSLVSIVVNILVAKYLGPSDFGIVGYITSFVALFSGIACLGMGNVIVKEIIDKNDSGKVIGSALILQLIASSICYVVVVLVVMMFNINNQTMLLCVLLQGLYLIVNSFDTIKYHYQARYESKYPTIILLVGYLAVEIYKIILLVTGKSVIWFSFAQTLQMLVVGILSIITYILTKGPKWSFSLTVAKSLLKQSLPFMVAGTLTAVYANIDKIMLKELLGDTANVGIYNVAFTISCVWGFIASAINTSFSPLIFEKAKANGIDSDEFKISCRQSYCIMFWVGFCAAIVVDLLAPFIISWFYGDEYSSAIIPTIILSWSVIFTYISASRSKQLVSENKQNYIMLFSIITVLINILLNLLMIKHWGVIGASVATLISEFFVCLIVPLLFKKTRNIACDIIKGIVFRGVRFREMVSQIKEKLFGEKNNNFRK